MSMYTYIGPLASNCNLIMEEKGAEPHILLVSYPSQGNINPLLRLAKQLAAKGLLVTLSSTHDIGRRIYASTNTVPRAINPVGKGHLRFEFFSDGWDIQDDPRRNRHDTYGMHLFTVGPTALAELVRRQAEEGRPVSCIVSSPFVPWALDVAEELNIPSAVLWVQSCSVYSTYYHYFHSLAEFPIGNGSSSDSVSIPGLPTLRFDEVTSFITLACFELAKAVMQSQFASIHKVKWVLANSFEELERDAIDGISKHSKIITIGPLVETGESNVKGDLWKAADDCIEWLDTQKPRSVVYVSVGSLASLGRDELAEMAYGLKSSGRPFLWVVRTDSERVLPEGFTEDVEGRGMVVDWCPQEEVLNHRALACFVTHCGWNSTLEMLNAGVPAIAYPAWGDQLTNAKFLVGVYEVGMRLNAPVERGEFVKCIEEVTDGGAKAEEMRKRCLVLKEAARSTVTEGGSSYRNIQAFVDEIKKRDYTAGQINGDQSDAAKKKVSENLVPHRIDYE